MLAAMREVRRHPQLVSKSLTKNFFDATVKAARGSVGFVACRGDHVSRRCCAERQVAGKPFMDLFWSLHSFLICWIPSIVRKVKIVRGEADQPQMSRKLSFGTLNNKVSHTARTVSKGPVVKPAVAGSRASRSCLNRNPRHHRLRRLHLHHHAAAQRRLWKPLKAILVQTLDHLCPQMAAASANPNSVLSGCRKLTVRSERRRRHRHRFPVLVLGVALGPAPEVPVPGLSR